MISPKVLSFRPLSLSWLGLMKKAFGPVSSLLAAVLRGNKDLIILGRVEVLPRRIQLRHD